MHQIIHTAFIMLLRHQGNIYFVQKEETGVELEKYNQIIL